MINFSASLQMCMNNIRKWSANPRIPLIAFLIAIFIKTYTDPVGRMVVSTGVAVTPFLFPFIMSGWYSMILLMLGIVLLFCDAPFIDEHQPYQIMRSNRKTWLTGQILYVIVGSALYFAFVIFVSSIFFVPKISFVDEWGKVWTTLARTNAASQYGLSFSVPYSIISSYHPLNALGLSFLMSWLVGSFLGLLLFVLNRFVNRAFGAFLCVAVVVFACFVNFGDVRMAYYSPITWTSLYIMDPYGLTRAPTTTYGLTTILILNTILITILYLTNRRDVDVLEKI